MYLFNSIGIRPLQRTMLVWALTLGLVGVASIGVSEAATAEDDVLKTVVRYTHGDLETDSGAQALYRRLTIAAGQVCPPPSGSPFADMEVKQCQENAIRRAVMEIKSPRLTGVLVAMTPVRGFRRKAHSIEPDSRQTEP